MAPDRISDAVETWVQLQVRDLIGELQEAASDQAAPCQIALRDYLEGPTWHYRLVGKLALSHCVYRIRQYDPYPNERVFDFTREYLAGSLLDPEALKAALRLAYLKGLADATTIPSFEDLRTQVESANAARK